MKCQIVDIIDNSEKKDSLDLDSMIYIYNLLIDNLKKILIKNKYNRKSEFTFENGTDQKRYYLYLLKCIPIIQDKIDNNIELSAKEYQKLYDYQEINKVLHKTTLSYKAQKLIETINTIHRLPLLKIQNNGKSEFTFDDRLDQRQYYTYLRRCIVSIRKK